LAEKNKYGKRKENRGKSRTGNRMKTDEMIEIQWTDLFEREVN